MDEPSQQLQNTLHAAIRDSLSAERPILTHLNADTSWLLQLPYPRRAKRPQGRSRWNILIDPWFQGPQSDVASWFSSQWHVVDSSVQSIEQLNCALAETEELAGRGDRRRYSDARLRKEGTNLIDCIIISHEFTDHCNQHTLLEVNQDVPIFAPKLAADLIKSWNHFYHVFEIPLFSTNEKDGHGAADKVLPEWLRISRLATESDSLYYHSAITITFDLTSRNDPQGAIEAIIYSPHGIHPDTLSRLPSATPPVHTLALLHGLHDVRLSVRQLNLGAHNGLQVQRLCKAKYWVSTHDEIKKARGLIAPFLSRKIWTIKEAIEQELKGQDDKGRQTEVVFADLVSGESLLLI